MERKTCTYLDWEPAVDDFPTNRLCFDERANEVEREMRTFIWMGASLRTEYSQAHYRQVGELIVARKVIARHLRQLVCAGPFGLRSFYLPSDQHLVMRSLPKELDGLKAFGRYPQHSLRKANQERTAAYHLNGFFRLTSAVNDPSTMLPSLFHLVNEPGGEGDVLVSTASRRPTPISSTF